MLLLLSLLAFLLFFRILGKKGIDWRRAALAAAVFWGSCVVVITETLSIPRLVTRNAVAIYWLVVCVASALYLRVLQRRTCPAAHDRQFFRESLDRATRILLVGVGVIILLVGVTAVVSAPNVWDAMEYHLPRVSMWMSNHSVAFFPTPDYAQLVFGTWAEYAMMHLDLLWGSDRLVNLVEFISFLGTITGVSLIAKLLGANQRGQALAALVCATIPEAVLEASGPMNTLVDSFWIVATVAFLLLSNEEFGWLNTGYVGMSVGLAILTKGSAYVYLPPLVVACWFIGSRAARMRFLKRCPVLLLLIFALNGPQYARAYDLTGSPLGLPFPGAGPRLHWMVERVGPRETLANTIRGLSIHTVAPSAKLNEHIEHGVRTLIRWAGDDPDDPGAVWPGMKFELNHFSVHEIHAGNPLHLLFFVVAMCLLVWKRRLIPAPRAIFWYASGIVASFVFFCAMLRWQIWESRHHAPLFVLAAVVIGIALAYCVTRRIAAATITILVAYALCFAVVNRTRALVPWKRVADVYHPRDVQYFADQHEGIAAANIAAAKYVNQLSCRDVAIDSYMPISDSRLYASPKSFFVYPLLAMIKADGRTRRVWYEGVQNLSAKYEITQPHPSPCVVICLDCAKAPDKWEEYRRVGGRMSVFDYIVVFSAKGAISNSDPLSGRDSTTGVPLRSVSG